MIYVNHSLLIKPMVDIVLCDLMWFFLICNTYRWHVFGRNFWAIKSPRWHFKYHHNEFITHSVSTKTRCSFQGHGQDICKHLIWRALQQELTAFSRQLLLEIYSSYMFTGILDRLGHTYYKFKWTPPKEKNCGSSLVTTQLKNSKRLLSQKFIHSHSRHRRLSFLRKQLPALCRWLFL